MSRSRPDIGPSVPPPPGVLDRVTALLFSGSCGRWSCCAANEDSVAGEGTALAASIEIGRVREMVGIEKVRAKEASDGKLEPDTLEESDGG